MAARLGPERLPWNLMAYSWASRRHYWRRGVSACPVLAAGCRDLVDPPLAGWAGRRASGRSAAGGGRRHAGDRRPAVEWAGRCGWPPRCRAGSVLRLRLVSQSASTQGRNRHPRPISLYQIDMTERAPGFAGITHVVWPETATRFLIERDPQVRRALAAVAPSAGAIITGAPRAEPLSGPFRQLWNSLVAIDHAGTITAVFDKFHLVPLGEYVPLRLSAVPRIPSV
jgi:apolipoprotein N-acyltransferase